MAAKPQGEAPAMAIVAPVELPPGYRFHPTDQQLLNFYLKRKILLQVHDFIPEVDLYNFEPSDLADKSFCPSRDDDPGADRPKVECYLFGPRSRKYTNGLRLNRTTPAGFWKSTGKDQPVMHHHMNAAIGMKKTLVYHRGRAPKGVRTEWVMHEYRLHKDDMTAIHDTYALCRVFQKKVMAPSPDVPGGADADKDGNGMQSIPDGAHADKDGMKAVALSPDVPGGADADKDGNGMQSIPDGTHTDKDGMKAMEVDMDNSGMMSIEPVGAEADMDDSWMMPFGPVSAEADMGLLVLDDAVRD